MATTVILVVITIIIFVAAVKLGPDGIKKVFLQIVAMLKKKPKKNEDNFIETPDNIDSDNK